MEYAITNVWWKQTLYKNVAFASCLIQEFVTSSMNGPVMKIDKLFFKKATWRKRN